MCVCVSVCLFFFLCVCLFVCLKRRHRGGGSKNSLVGLNAKLLSNFNFNN